MGKVISIVNQKGGVGKTTTVINLSTALVAVGKKVLILDCDPQGNASTGLGVPKSKEVCNMLSFLQADFYGDYKKYISKTKMDNLSIISSNMNLSSFDSEYKGKTRVLQDKLNRIRNEYDFIIIDCPPSLGMLTINALVASDTFLVPMQCEFFALEGISHLMETYKAIKAKANTELLIEGIVLTMYDKRNNLTQQVENEVRKVFADHVYKVVIPRNVRIAESSSYGEPVLVYALQSAGAMAYIDLAREVIERNNLVIV